MVGEVMEVDTVALHHIRYVKVCKSLFSIKKSDIIVRVCVVNSLEILELNQCK